MLQLIPGLEPTSLYEYRGQRLTIFTIVWIVVQVVFVALRMYARHIIKADYSIDGLLCIAALVAQLALAGLALGSIFHAGVGHHQAILSVETQETFGKYLFAISVVYVATINLAKFAILDLYYRVFSREKAVRWAIYVIGSVMIAQTISTTIAALAVCEPVAANWNPSLLEMPNTGHCQDREALYRWSSFPGIVVDLSLLILPLPVIAKLNMSMKLKVSVFATFIVGSFGLIGSCIRFSRFYQIDSFVDATWNAPELITWTEVEGGVYLISACLMTFKPLVERIGGSALPPRSSASGKHKNDSYAKRGWREYMKRTSEPVPKYPLRSMDRGSGFQKLHDRVVLMQEEGKNTARESTVVAV